MSKYVKDLITKDLRKRLDGVEDALLVDVIGLENDKNVALRQRLRKKNIHLLVVKNSLARRATEGTRAGAGVRRRRRARWPSSGAAKTSSRWPKKSSASPRTRSSSRSRPRAA